MLVGIIGAMNVEVAELLKSMKLDRTEVISSVEYHVGEIDGYKVVIAKCGVGKVHASICTQTMILRFSPDVIINTGVAGSLSPELDVGDVAIGSSVVQYDMDTSAVGDPVGLISGINVIEFSCDELVLKKLIYAVEHLKSIHYKVGLIATGDRFLNSREGKEKILENFNAIACEMESGSIAQVCYVNKKPFGIIRAISDNADSVSHVEYGEFLTDAAAKATAVVKSFLELINSAEGR